MIPERHGRRIYDAAIRSGVNTELFIVEEAGHNPALYKRQPLSLIDTTFQGVYRNCMFDPMAKPLKVEPQFLIDPFRPAYRDVARSGELAAP